MNSWLVNGCMFAIVAIIFLASIFRAFIPVNSLICTLRYKTKEIDQESSKFRAKKAEPEVTFKP